MRIQNALLLDITLGLAALASSATPAAGATFVPTESTLVTESPAVLAFQFDIANTDEVVAASLALPDQLIGWLSGLEDPIARLKVAWGQGSVPSVSELVLATTSTPNVEYLKSNGGGRSLDCSRLFLEGISGAQFWVAVSIDDLTVPSETELDSSGAALSTQAAPMVSSKGRSTAKRTSVEPEQMRKSAERSRLVMLRNPIRTNATIRLWPKVSGEISLEVYNLAGRKVFVSRHRVSAGLPMDLGWAGSDEKGASVASGVYLIRVAGSGMDLREKIVLIR